MIARGKYDVSAGASGAIFGIIGALLWIVMNISPDSCNLVNGDRGGG